MNYDNITTAYNDIMHEIATRTLSDYDDVDEAAEQINRDTVIENVDNYMIYYNDQVVIIAEYAKRLGGDLATASLTLCDALYMLIDDVEEQVARDIQLARDIMNDTATA